MERNGEVIDGEPARLACPGFLGYRHFAAVNGSAKFMVMYELEQSPAEQEQSKRIQGSWTNRVRNMYVEVETPHTAR